MFKKASTDHKRLSKEQCEFIYAKLRSILTEKIDEIIKRHAKASKVSIYFNGCWHNEIPVISVEVKPPLKRSHFDIPRIVAGFHSKASCTKHGSTFRKAGYHGQFRNTKDDFHDDKWMLNQAGLKVVEAAERKAEAIHDALYAEINAFMDVYRKAETEAILGIHEISGLFESLAKYKA